jgi:hypothetical protein
MPVDVPELASLIRQQSPCVSKLPTLQDIPSIPDTLTLTDVARIIETNASVLFGSEARTKELNSFSINSKNHQMRKKSVEERFFYVLSQRDDFRHFCDFVVDPDTHQNCLTGKSGYSMHCYEVDLLI